jgi:polyhydroxybutyrate depolymerase
MPVMIVHGRKDPFVLFEGGSSSPISFPKRSNMGVPEALSLWSAADGCAAPPALSEPAPGRLRRSVSGPCRDGSEIVLWEIEDGEHNWPANVRFPAPDSAPRTAAAEILAFFARHSRE